MDFVQGLNVTIYGLGIVFLALLVLMFSIMVLGKAFSVVTGKEMISAVGNGNGASRQAAVLPEAAAVPAAPASVALKMGYAGKQYKVELNASGNNSAVVSIDGVAFQIERDAVDVKKLMVNGKAHTIEVKEVTDSAALVVIDGAERKVEIVHQEPAAAAPLAPVPAPSPAPAVAPTPAPAVVVAAPRTQAAGEQVTAPLPGKILSVAVKAGDAVNKGDEICVIEAMKMGNSIKAQRAGTIKDVLVSSGDSVAYGAALVVIG